MCVAAVSKISINRGGVFREQRDMDQSISVARVGVWKVRVRIGGGGAGMMRAVTPAGNKSCRATSCNIHLSYPACVVPRLD